MTDKDNSPHLAALQDLEAALDAHRRAHGDAVAPTRARESESGRKSTPLNAGNQQRWSKW
jgi:hypothetical protein